MERWEPIKTKALTAADRPGSGKAYPFFSVDAKAGVFASYLAKLEPKRPKPIYLSPLKPTRFILPKPIEDAFVTLDKSVRLSGDQRDWLAKGIRDWSGYVFPAPSLGAVERRPHPQRKFFDLSTFLFDRHLVTNRRRTERWSAGFARRPRAINWSQINIWLHYAQLEFERRVRSAPRPWEMAAALLGGLRAPPTAAIAIRGRHVLEACIHTILERLADSISPNAPSRPALLRRDLSRGGTAAFR